VFPEGKFLYNPEKNICSICSLERLFGNRNFCSPKRPVLNNKCASPEKLVWNIAKVKEMLQRLSLVAMAQTEGEMEKEQMKNGSRDGGTYTGKKKRVA